MPSVAAPTAVVSGWAGSTNLGDELLGLALVRKLDARGVRPLVVSTSPDVTAGRLGTDVLAHGNWPAVWRAIRAANGLIFGGGSLIQDVTSHLNLPYHLARPRLAALAGTPFSSVGLGAGPVRTGIARSLTRRVLSRARQVGVRDAGSADLLRSFGVERVVVGADLALSLPTPTGTTSDRIVVSLRPPVPGGLVPVASRTHSAGEPWLAAAAAALDEAAGATGLGVHFVPMQTDRDDAVHRQVAERMHTAATHATPTLDSVLDDLASGQVVVAMRYHGAIGALMGSRPAVLLGYAPKVDSLAEEVGSGFALLDSDPGGLRGIPAALAGVLGTDEQVADGLARLRERERRNDDVLDDLLAVTK